MNDKLEERIPLHPFLGSIRLLLLSFLLLGLQDPIRSSTPIIQTAHNQTHTRPRKRKKKETQHELVLKLLGNVDGRLSIRLQFGEDTRIFELCCARRARDVRPSGFTLVRKVACEVLEGSVGRSVRQGGGKKPQTFA